METPAAFVLFKALLGFGLPLAFGIQQLIVTKRAIRADRRAAAVRAPACVRPTVADSQTERLSNAA